MDPKILPSYSIVVVVIIHLCNRCCYGRLLSTVVIRVIVSRDVVRILKFRLDFSCYHRNGPDTKASEDHLSGKIERAWGFFARFFANDA
ncbi:hypothetical protein Tco_0518205 [Tanacetum coccineum]